MSGGRHEEHLRECVSSHFPSGHQKHGAEKCSSPLQESLDEVTIKDTLEGDNMYTCSQCGKKVRAEKR